MRLPTIRSAKKGVRLPVPSSTVVCKDSDEMNSSVASQSDFDASSISDDENEPTDDGHSYQIHATKDEISALLGLDDSSSIIEEENESKEEYTSALSILKEKRINRFETTVNHPKTKVIVNTTVSMSYNTNQKIMRQPGKLVNPVDASTQTFRRTGAIKSFMKENPEKREKLRQWLRGERDSFR